MSCEKYLEMISDEVDAELQESESLSLMRHLVLCSDCRNEYSDNLKLKVIIKEELIYSPVLVPNGFSAKIVDSIENSPLHHSQPPLPVKIPSSLSGLLAGIKGIFPANVPSFALPLAASLLMVVSLGFYYKSSPDATKSGYVMTDAKDIDAKLIRASAEPFSGKQGDEFAYYSNRHLNAVQSASIDKYIV